MQSTASINLTLHASKTTDFFQFFNPSLLQLYGLTSSKCVIPVQTAVRYQFPVRTEVMVVSFRGHLDSRFRQLAYEPLACAVIGFYLDTEFPLKE